MSEAGLGSIPFIQEVKLKFQTEIPAIAVVLPELLHETPGTSVILLNCLN